MLRALWFFIKLGLVVAVVVWFIDRPGSLHLEWQGYIIDMSFGFAAAMFFAVLFLFAVLYHIWRRFISLPKSWRKYNEEKRQTKGYQAITKGLLALAAGDTTACKRQTDRARKLLPGTPLTKLLEAQTAQMRGDAVAARQHFTALLESKEGFFFGVRGLLTQALQKGELDEALEMARQAYRKEPNRGWILLTLFDLEVRHRNWDQAREILARAMKKNVLDKYIGKKHHAAILLAQSDEELHKNNLKKALNLAEKAQKFFPDFVPIATRRAKILDQMDKKKQAQKILRQIWRASPHPDIVRVWNTLIGDKSLIPTARMKAMHDLVSGQPDHLESHIAMAETALNANLWGIARDHLTKALEMQPDVRVYRLLARLESEGTQDHAAARHWMEKAGKARDEARWVCSNTGAVFDQWYALNPSDGSFNTVEWRIPASWGNKKIHAIHKNEYEPFQFLSNPQIIELDE